MAKTYKVDYIDNATQKDETKIFMVISDFFFDRYCVKHGIVVRNKTEVSHAQYLMAPKDKRVYVNIL